MDDVFNYTMDSNELLSKSQVIEDGKVTLDMRGDKRLHKLVDTVSHHINRKHWKIPENEKDICEYISKQMHRKEYYGLYDNNSKAMQFKIADLEKNIGEIEKNEGDHTKQQEMKKHLRAEDEKEYKQLGDYTIAHNLIPLKDVKSGQTVCHHQAAIMSYTMGSVGIHNKLCFGVGTDSNPYMGHVFVQSEMGKKNIIDPVTTEIFHTCYFENMNGGEISKHQVVMTEASYKGNFSDTIYYGGGPMPPLNKDMHLPAKQKKQWDVALKDKDMPKLAEIVVERNRDLAKQADDKKTDERLAKQQRAERAADAKYDNEHGFRAISGLSHDIKEKVQQHGKHINSQHSPDQATNRPHQVGASQRASRLIM